MWILWSWQFWPVYLLLLAVALIPVRFVKWRLVVIGALALVSLAAWTVLPIPSLPLPDGPYGVGTITFRWVDGSRPELATDAPNDRRNVVLQAFYPIAKGTAGAHSIYMDGLKSLPASVSILPRFVFAHFDKVDTHNITGTTVSADRECWPVVLFSPGYGASRSFYTALITGIASSGRVVLAIDHPYEAGVVELADRSVVTNHIRNLPGDPDRLGYMRAQQEIRVADIRFALDRISRVPLGKHLDLDDVAAVGHSFGGASSMEAMALDSRIKAAVNIDGTPYGSLPTRHLTRRVMLVESDPTVTHHGKAYSTGNRQILSNVTGSTSYRYTLRQTNHFSFSDLPLFLSPLGRWALSVSLGGSRDPGQVNQATLQLLTAFLSKPAVLEQVAARYEWIKGGRVK